MSQTVGEVYKVISKRPGFAQRLETLQPLDKLEEKIFSLAMMASTFALIPTSKSYEPLLTSAVKSSLAARGMAFIITKVGRRIAQESKELPGVANALRAIARDKCRDSTVMKKAVYLHGVINRTTVIDTLFAERNLENPYWAFVKALRPAVSGNKLAIEELKRVATLLASTLRYSRGPKLSAASVAHELLQETLAHFGAPAGYTRNPYARRFSDPASIATGQEFGIHNFDPQAAHRRRRRGPSSYSLLGSQKPTDQPKKILK
jgi:hypothetical protein